MIKRFNRLQDVSPDGAMKILASIMSLVQEYRSGEIYILEGMEYYLHFASECDAVPNAFIAVRNDGEGKWIQYAWTDPPDRRMGLFRTLVHFLKCDYPGKKIGLGTAIHNEAMMTAAKGCGFEQSAVYLYYTPEAA